MGVAYTREVHRFLAVLVLVPGCTIVFNTNDLPRIADAPVDAVPPDAAIGDAFIADVNSANLVLTSVEPTALVEGTGSAGGRPVVIVVRGENIDSTAVVSITPGADAVPIGLMMVGETVVSTDHTMAARAVTVPVLSSLAAGAHLGLQVSLVQPGAAT